MDPQWRRRRRETFGQPQHDAVDASWFTATLTLVAGALLTVTTGCWIIQELERFGPAVGGMVVFKPDAAATDGWSVTASVIGPGQPELSVVAGTGRCGLSPGVMAMRGGSLIIEARRLSRPLAYRVHWSGGHTDVGPGD